MADSPSTDTGTNWKRIPMTNPVSAAWVVHISSSDRAKMLKGYIPQDMDDKWYLYADGPDDQGNFVLRMYRSWTSEEQVAVSVNSTGFTQIQWKEYPGEGEEEAKGLARALCKGFLGCELEALPAPMESE